MSMCLNVSVAWVPSVISTCRQICGILQGDRWLLCSHRLWQHLICREWGIFSLFLSLTHTHIRKLNMLYQHRIHTYISLQTPPTDFHIHTYCTHLISVFPIWRQTIWQCVCDLTENYRNKILYLTNNSISVFPSTYFMPIFNRNNNLSINKTEWKHWK